MEVKGKIGIKGLSGKLSLNLIILNGMIYKSDLMFYK